MPKKSKGKRGEDGTESAGKKKNKPSKFDMLKADLGDEENSQEEDSARAEDTKKQPKKGSKSKMAGDPGFRPKDSDDDEDLEVVHSFIHSVILSFIHSLIRLHEAEAKLLRQKLALAS